MPHLWVRRRPRLMPVRCDCAGALPGVSVQHVAAVRPAEAGDERGSGRWPDLDVRAEGGEHRREQRGIGVLEVKSFQGEPARR